MGEHLPCLKKSSLGKPSAPSTRQKTQLESQRPPAIPFGELENRVEKKQKELILVRFILKPLVKCEAILQISNQPVLSGVRAENIGKGC